MARTKSSVDKAWLVRNGFFCKKAFAEQARKQLQLALIGLLLVFAAKWAPAILHPEMLAKARDQGLGPELWNVAGTPGLIGLGLFILFPTARVFAASGIIALEISYSLGAVMVGVFAGEFLIAAPQELQMHGAGWTLFIGVIAAIALTACALMNYVVWYLSWLVRGDIRFQNWLTSLPVTHRIALGLFFVLMPALTYVFQ
jgi:hypothetical protein